MPPAGVSDHPAHGRWSRNGSRSANSATRTGVRDVAELMHRGGGPPALETLPHGARRCVGRSSRTSIPVPLDEAPGTTVTAPSAADQGPKSPVAGLLGGWFLAAVGSAPPALEPGVEPRHASRPKDPGRGIGHGRCSTARETPAPRQELLTPRRPR